MLISVDPRKVFAVTIALIVAVPAVFASAPLRSPWDARTIPATDRPWSCPAPIPIPRDVVLYDYYSDSHLSVPDPTRLHAYQMAAAPFDRTMEAAEQAADFYQKTGSRQAAACVGQFLDAAAREQAMTGSMASNQSYYVQNWTLGALAITWLKVRSSGAISPVQNAEILGLVKTVARSTKGYFSGRRAKNTKDGRNNHLYSAGLAVMAAGIATNDRKFYNWGISTYRDGVGRIGPDGTLPLEMARGRRALHYHIFAAQPLVAMAEFGEANGQDLYAVDDDALGRLVGRCVSGLETNAWFARKTGFPQDTPGNRLTAADVAWMRPYARRFPEPAIARLLAQVRSQNILYLGGAPPP